MPNKRTIAIAALLAGLAMLAALLATSCSSSVGAIPVRTFERAQRVDFVCMKVLDDQNGPPCQQSTDCVAPSAPLNVCNIAAGATSGTCLIAQPPVPVQQSLCAPVGSTTNGGDLPYHLYAVVTQSIRGELAVVDLTAGFVVDTSATAPGINFLPVGQLPTDVAAAPDGKMVFVGAAEVNKPAIYGIYSTEILGDALQLTGAQYADAGIRPAALSSWPVCALPQAPGNIVIVPTTSGSDGGTGPGYQLVVALPGNAVETAKIVTIDPQRFLDSTRSDRYPPGQLVPCVYSSIIELSCAPSKPCNLPSSWSPGPAWSDGLTYVDGGVDLFQPVTVAGDAGGVVRTRMPARVSCDEADAGLSDAGLSDAASDAGDAAGDAAGEFALRPTPGTRPHVSSLAVAGTTVYVGDDELPLIHVLDYSQLGKQTPPQELQPLVVSSALEPARVVTVKQVAVSPPTRDYKQYLYAIDRAEGSVIVYDVTDPVLSSHTPLSKPHPELNPFEPPDRILFNVPVAAVEFIRHDFPLAPVGTPPVSGALCDPNPNDNDPVAFPGSGYVAGAPQPIVGLGPARLRGVFAMVTLSNALVATIDVDDWDAPCRRPTLLGGIGAPITPATATQALGDLAISQSAGSGPYATPNGVAVAGTDNTSEEWYFPVSQPHRPRSLYLLGKNTTIGIHVPNTLGLPLLYENGALASGSSKDSMLRATTDVSLIDPWTCNQALPLWSCVQSQYPPGTPAVRLAFDDPHVHVDQDWAVTFEGTLPNFAGLAATVSPIGNYSALSLSITGGGLCRRGVEDARLGHLRFDAMTSENPTYLGDSEDARLGDYVQLSDDLLGGGSMCPQNPSCDADAYWQENNSCWDGPLATDASTPTDQRNAIALNRWDQCAQFFGAQGSQQNPARDFPILEAYDDHLIVAQYDYKDHRAAAPSGHFNPRAAAPEVMRLAQCCFHNQVHFNVRTGGEWVAVGSVSGYLHHVVADASTQSCVLSCEKRETLLSARMPEVFSPPGSPDLDRDSSFALRNPIFSAYMRATGKPKATTDSTYNAQVDNGFTFTPRDAAWKIQIRGGFIPQTISLATTTIAVVPQSMRFIPALNDLAVVDGASQGLVLIDLNTVTVAHNPYF